MIRLITGLPGAGKTLFSINEIENNYQDFHIYYHRIDGLNISRWNYCEDPTRWFELPPRSVLLVDEAQRIWPAQGAHKNKPESISRMEEHRHTGVDLWFITQNPKLLDHEIRRLAGQHINYHRAFGLERSNWKEYERFVDVENDKERTKPIRKGSSKFPKHVYDKYKSAETHTVKKRIPKKLWLILCLPFIFVACGGYAFYTLSSFGTNSKASMQKLISGGRDPYGGAYSKHPASSSASSSGSSSTAVKKTPAKFQHEGYIKGYASIGGQGVAVVKRPGESRFREIPFQSCKPEKYQVLVCRYRGVAYRANYIASDQSGGYVTPTNTKPKKRIQSKQKNQVKSGSSSPSASGDPSTPIGTSQVTKQFNWGYG